MLFAILVLCYLAVFVISASFFSKREGYLSLFVVFGVTAFYYYLSVPIDLWLRGESGFSIGPVWYSLEGGELVYVAAASVLALLGYAMGHHLSNFRIDRNLQGKSSLSARLPISLVVMGSGAFLLASRQSGFDFFGSLSYHDRYALVYDSPVLALTSAYLNISLVVLGAILLRGQRRTAMMIGVLFLAVVFMRGLLTHDKDPILIAVLGFGSILVGRSRSHWYLVGFSVATMVAVFLLPVFSIIRSHGEVDLSRAIKEFNVVNTDASGPMASVSVAVSGDEPYRWGATYFLTSVSWIPKSIWAERPEDLALQFARTEMRGWSAGRGLGYSPLAESLLNFGLPGAFFQYFFIAFIYGKLWMFLQARVPREHLYYWCATYVCNGYYFLAILHRGPTSGFVKTGIYFVVIPWLLFFLLDSQPKEIASASFGRRRIARARV